VCFDHFRFQKRFTLALRDCSGTLQFCCLGPRAILTRRLAKHVLVRSRGTRGTGRESVLGVTAGRARVCAMSTTLTQLQE